MIIDEFIWLTEMVEKIESKHGVIPDEVEQIFFNQPRYRFVESGNQVGEDVYSADGQTDAGRYLIVFFIHKTNHQALILSARAMDSPERKRYERK